jgi:chromosome segregation ATPase
MDSDKKELKTVPEMIEEKDIEILRLKDLVDYWQTESEKFKKISEESLSQMDTLRKELEGLEIENTSIRKRLEQVLNEKTDLTLKLRNKEQLLRAIRSIAEVQ